jgi:hypothetical protein
MKASKPHRKYPVHRDRFSLVELPVNRRGYAAEPALSFIASLPLSGRPCSCLRGGLRGFTRTFSALLGGERLRAGKAPKPTHFRHHLRNLIILAHEENGTP